MTCVKTALAAVTATMFAAAAAQADADGWCEVHARDGVQVLARTRAGSPIKEMRAISDIDASPERVLAVLDDIEHYPQFMPPTSAAQLLHRDGDYAHYYVEISPPVIARRDYCIRVGTQRLAGGRLRSYWMADNTGCPPERPGVVRVRSHDGEWLLEPLDGGRRTRALYRFHIEVVSQAPAWMVNRATASELPNVLIALRRAVGQPRYAAARPTPL